MTISHWFQYGPFLQKFLCQDTNELSDSYKFKVDFIPELTDFWDEYFCDDHSYNGPWMAPQSLSVSSKVLITAGGPAGLLIDEEHLFLGMVKLSIGNTLWFAGHWINDLLYIEPGV